MYYIAYMRYARHDKTFQKNKPRHPVSYRIPEKLIQRFSAVVRISRRPKASIIHESIEAMLPVLEKRYAAELLTEARQGKAQP